MLPMMTPIVAAYGDFIFFQVQQEIAPNYKALTALYSDQFTSPMQCSPLLYWKLTPLNPFARQ